MCPKKRTNICMPRRDDDNRLMGHPMIELEFEKDNLDPHIIIEGKHSIMNEERETNFM